MNLGLSVFLLHTALFVGSGWLFPRNRGAELALLAVAAILMVVQLRRRAWSARRIASTLALYGVMTSTLWMLVPKCAAAWHYPGTLTVKITLLFFRVFGIQGQAIGNGMLGLTLDSMLAKVNLTTEALALLPTFACLATWLGVGALIGDPVPHPLWSVAVSYAYLIVRFCLLTLGGYTLRNAEPFWDLIPYLLSLVPLGFILLILPRKAVRVSRAATRLAPFAAGGIVVACCLLAGFLCQAVHLPVSDDVRVMMDDSHSEWEWSTIAFDTALYGKKSNYNYYCLRSWLENFGAVEVNESLSLDQIDLNRYNLLLLKTPTKPYSAEEVRVISDYVRGGGRLLILGDHTDFLGTSTNLNALLASMCSIRINLDATYTLRTSLYQVFNTGFGNSVLNGVDRIQFLTSSSLSAPLSADYVIVDGNLGSSRLDYANPGYFGRMSIGFDSLFGYFASCIGTTVGKGRVLVFSDSTIFSNFSMFYNDHAQLMFNFTRYLLSPTWFGRARMLILPAVALIAIVTVLLLVAARRDALVVGLIILGVLSVVTGDAVARRVVHQNPYESVARNTVIAFDNSISQFELPPYGREHVPNPKDAFDTFYVWTQRLRLIPLIADSTDRAGEVSDTLVLIHPRLELVDKEYAEGLARFLAGGRRVLVILTSDAGRTSLTAWLPFLREGIAEQPADGIEVIEAAGGTLLVTSKDYSRETMGYLDEIPGSKKGVLFSEAFRLIQRATGR